MKRIIDKTVNLNLVGVDGNAFNILGLFKRQAFHDGWTKQEIDAVIQESQKGNYDHLVSTIQMHCEPKNQEAHDD